MHDRDDDDRPEQSDCEHDAECSEPGRRAQDLRVVDQDPEQRKRSRDLKDVERDAERETAKRLTALHEPRRNVPGRARGYGVRRASAEQSENEWHFEGAQHVDRAGDLLGDGEARGEEEAKRDEPDRHMQVGLWRGELGERHDQQDRRRKCDPDHARDEHHVHLRSLW